MKRTSNDWEDVHQSRIWGTWPDEFLIRTVNKYLGKERGSRRYALDIGCGVGASFPLLVEHGYVVYGIDISPTAAIRARQNLEKLESGRLNLDTERPPSVANRILVADLSGSFPLFDVQFDLIVDIETLCRLPFEVAQERLTEAYNFATPGAALVARVFSNFQQVGGGARPTGLGSLVKAVSGPLAGMPAQRLTSEEEIQELVAPWHIADLELAERHSRLNNERVSEWLIRGVKK